MKSNLIILLTLTFITFSCNKKEDEPAPIKISDFLGTYTFDASSYNVPLDSAGNEIATERVSMENERVNVSLGASDSLVFQSLSLGTLKGKPEIVDRTIRVPIVYQPYNGKDTDPTGQSYMEAVTPFVLEERGDKKMFRGDCRLQQPSARTRRYFSTGFK